MKNRFLLLLPIFTLTACGQGVFDIAAPTKLDHSGTWNDNYYTVFDKELKEREVTKVTLDKINNKVFREYGDDNFRLLEPNYDQYTIYDYMPNSYGEVFKYSRYSESVKYGFTSKLFDGQMNCNGDYEGARIQINEDGFSGSFGRTLNSASYLYLHFKSAIDFKNPALVPSSHYSNITIRLTFYKDDSATEYSYPLTDIPSNFGDGYTFFGFSLEGIDIKGVKHYAISYTLDYDPLKEEEPSVGHALFMYELGFKNPAFLD